MKAIFTYPNNAATSYIDPLYVGDASDGFQKRIQDLKDGNYKIWDGTAPTDSVSDLMSNISKFNEYYNVRGDNNVTIDDMYTYPLLTGTITDIQQDITATLQSNTIAEPTVITTTVAHGMSNGLPVSLSGFNETLSFINGDSAFVKVIDANNINLALDAGLTTFIGIRNLGSSAVTLATAVADSIFTSVGHDFINGLEVTATAFGGDIADQIDNFTSLFVEIIDADSFYLTSDAGLTNRIGMPNPSFTAIGSNVLDIRTEYPTVRLSGYSSLSDGSPIKLFNATNTNLNPTIKSQSGIRLWLKSTSTTDVYDLYDDFDLTNQSESISLIGDKNNLGLTELVIAWSDQPIWYVTSSTVLSTTRPYVITSSEANDGGVSSGWGLSDVNYYVGPVTTGFDSLTYYLKLITSNTYELYTDAALTIPLLTNTSTNIVTIDDALSNYDRLRPGFIKNSEIYTDTGQIITKSDDGIFGAFTITDETVPDNIYDIKPINNLLLPGLPSSSNGQIQNIPGQTYNGKQLYKYMNFARPSALFEIGGGSAFYYISINFLVGGPVNSRFAWRINASLATDFEFNVPYYGANQFPAGSGDDYVFIKILSDNNSQVYFDIYRKSQWDAGGLTPDVFGYNTPLINILSSKQIAEAQNGASINSDDISDVFTKLPSSNTIFVNGTPYIGGPGNPPPVIADITDIGINAGSVAAMNLTIPEYKTYTVGQSDYLLSEISGSNTLTSSINHRTSAPIESTLNPFYDIITGDAITIDGVAYIAWATDGLSQIYSYTLTDFANKVDISINIKNVNFIKKNGSNALTAFPIAYKDSNNNFVVNVTKTFATTGLNYADGPLLSTTDITMGPTPTTISHHLGYDTVIHPMTAGSVYTEQAVLFDSYTGQLDEVAGTIIDGTIAVVNPTISTQGTVFYDDPPDYALTAIDLIIPANNNYTYQNSSNVATPGAEVAPTYQNIAGTVFAHPSTPNITLTTDGNGRLTGATLNSNLSGYPSSGDISLSVEALPDQYVPPAPNTAADEDIFDTVDYWTQYGYTQGQKEFGKNIIPTSASITYVQPSTTNMSQNGRKYVRSSGFVKTKLEVNYTNLTKAEFQELHADAQAARGQAMPFYLVIGRWGDKVLTFKNQTSTMQPRLIEPYVAGTTLLKLGGFSSNESEAFKKGEMLIGLGTENGGVLTVLNTVDANVYGEAKIRVAYGSNYYIANSGIVYKNPYHLIVTFDGDDFQYTVDTFGKYNVTATFETGSYNI